MYKNGCLILFCIMISVGLACRVGASNTTSNQPVSPDLLTFAMPQKSKVYYVHDTIALGKSSFTQSRNYGFNFKLGGNTRWIQFVIRNIDTTATSSVVELTNPFLNHVEFYTINSGKIVDSFTTGSAFEFHHRQKDHPNFLYTIMVPPQGVVQCYVAIKTGNVSGDFRLIVWAKDKRADYQIFETKYLSYFFIINISFLFLVGVAISLTRQRYHWYYFIYALFGFVYIYSEVGLGFKNFWPDHPQFQNTCILFIANIYQIFGLLFVRKYFSTAERLPLAYKLFSFLILAGIVCELWVIGNIGLQHSLLKGFVMVNTLLFVASGLSVFSIAALSTKFKMLRSDAIWFIIGFTPHAISILQLCLRPFGLFNNNNEVWFKDLVPVYIDTIHPPNLLLWATLWEMIIVFVLIIKRLKRLYEDNSAMMKMLAFQREKNMYTLLSGVEKERQRIAQELHDGSGVALSALKMKLHVLKEKDNFGAHVAEIGALMKDVDHIYEDIRAISHDLMPKTLSKLGLYPAIDELVSQFRTAAPQIKFSYHQKTCVNYFNETAKINIYRIVQELLTNIVKHSEAKEVTLQIIKHNDILMISVEDDGKGFDIREVHSGVGLTSIESRVQMLNGSLSVDAAPQNGTFISVSFPVADLK